MIFAITRDGITVATVTADSLVFGRKMKPGSLMEKETIDDPKLFKMLDPEGKTAFIVAMAKDYNAEQIG